MTEEELLHTYTRAWNAHDAAGCAACFAPDGIREPRVSMHCRPPSGGDGVAAGRAEIAAAVGGVLGALPDLAVEVVGAAYSSDRRLWTEWRARGRAGAIDVLGVSVFRLGADGFTEERLYWDSAAVPARRR